jgi:uncharacterized protein YjiS (DUF1127 family)
VRAGTGESASPTYNIRPAATYLILWSRYRGTGRDEKETREMIIVQAILSASALLHGRGAQPVGRSVVRTFKRWQAACTAWHRERRAMAELLSMSDRDLRDIGISRCEIPGAVRDDTARERNTVHGAIPISFAISRPSERGHQY